MSDNHIRVVAVYDNLGKTLDRYTVLTDAVDKHPSGEPWRDQYPYLGMSEGGDGFSQWGFIERATHATLLKKTTQGYRATTHLGRLVPFENLSAATQSHIAYRVLTTIEEDENEQYREDVRQGRVDI